MYEFTNGIVVFDEKSKEAYLKSGYKLVEKEKSAFATETGKEFVGPLKNDKLNKAIEKEILKVINENTSNNGTIKKQSKKCNRLSK